MRRGLRPGTTWSTPAGDRPEHFKHGPIPGAKDDRRTHNGDRYLCGISGRSLFGGKLAAAIIGHRSRYIAFHARPVISTRSRGGQRGHHDQHRRLSAVSAGGRDGFNAAGVDTQEIIGLEGPQQTGQVKHDSGLRLGQYPSHGGPIGHISRDQLSAR